VSKVATVDLSKVMTSSLSPDATELFKASGLGDARSLGSLRISNATHWISVRAQVHGYVPGSQVYLAVTTKPIIFGSARVDRLGTVSFSGLLPVDVLEAAAHSIRIVGTRNLGGVTVDSNGKIQLSDTTMRQIQRFDQGTNAVIEVRGSSANGTHAAIRLVPLTQTIPWWVLWVYLIALLAVFIVRRRFPRSRTAMFTLWLVGGIGMIAVEVIAWIQFAYIMLPWAPVAFAVVLLVDIFYATIRRVLLRRGKARRRAQEAPVTS